MTLLHILAYQSPRNTVIYSTKILNQPWRGPSRTLSVGQHCLYHLLAGAILSRWQLCPGSYSRFIQCLFLSQSPFFKELDKSISVFVWNKTIPRIRRAHLEKQKEAGGLALPNCIQYYWAANINKLIYWVSVSYEGDRPPILCPYLL